LCVPIATIELGDLESLHVELLETASVDAPQTRIEPWAVEDVNAAVPTEVVLGISIPKRLPSFGVEPLALT
jgi:hypothetical protein